MESYRAALLAIYSGEVDLANLVRNTCDALAERRAEQRAEPKPFCDMSSDRSKSTGRPPEPGFLPESQWRKYF